jgi:DNA-binding transcriptional MerR regulator
LHILLLALSLLFSLSMSNLMLRNQILGLRRAGMSYEEISAALEVDNMVVKLALEATGGSAVLRKEALAEKEDDITDDVSEQEAKEMMGIIKNIARDEESGVYARLNAAKYAHGATRGYHKRHLDLNVGSGELLLKINEAYTSASMRARAALGGQSLTAKEITIEAPITVEATVEAPQQPTQSPTSEQPAAQKPRPFKL